MSHPSYHDYDNDYEERDKARRAELEEEKRVARQLAIYKELMSKPPRPNKFVVSDKMVEKLTRGSWDLETTSKPTTTKPNQKESEMPIFQVIATRKITIPQPDGGLQSVERLVVNKDVIAADAYGAALIAGKGLEATDEELSTVTTKVTQKA